MRFVNEANARARAWRVRPSRTISLAGTSVLIIGGSRGLGLELAREFGRRGARVAIAARDADELERARLDLRARGVTVHAQSADIRDEHDVQGFVAAAEAALGPADVLVNDAGIIAVGPVDVMALDDYRRALDTHFWGPLYAMRAVVPGMRRRGRGRIVNIASIGGRVSFPHLIPYNASKFALVGLSEGMRAELLGDQIFVTTVIPGLMRTGSPENAEFKAQHRKEYGWFSISDSLPFLSMDVVAAARAIADATERGDAELTLTIPAKIGSIAHGVFPGLVSDALALVARLLPGPGGIGSESRRGRDSHSAASPSPLTAATQQRAATQNQVQR